MKVSKRPESIRTLQSKHQTGRGYPGLVYWQQTEDCSLWEGQEVQWSSPQCLLPLPTVTRRHKQNACKKWGQAAGLAIATFSDPNTRFWWSSLMFREGTKPPRFSALSQQRNQNLKHYFMFPRTHVGLHWAATRTVEHCSHLVIPWGHC